MDRPPPMTVRERKRKQLSLEAQGYIRLIILSKREDLCSALMDTNYLSVLDQDNKEKINAAATKALNSFVAQHNKEKSDKEGVSRVCV